MVLMAMGNENSTYLIPILNEIGNVRDRKVHTRHVCAWKENTSIYDDDVVTIFNGHHIMANFA